MTPNSVTFVGQETVDRINELHDQATSHAQKAVQHATELGALLLEVKSKVGHGCFTAWIKQNLKVTPRQARRYISAALGRPQRVELSMDKTDTMSVLGDLPIFLPLPGSLHYLFNQDASDLLAVVEPCAGFPAFFFVTVFDPPPATGQPRGFSYTHRPIEGIAVDGYLEFSGVPKPREGNWHFRSSEGVKYAGESLSHPAYAEGESLPPKLSPRRLIGAKFSDGADGHKKLSLDAEIEEAETRA